MLDSQDYEGLFSEEKGVTKKTWFVSPKKWHFNYRGARRRQLTACKGERNERTRIATGSHLLVNLFEESFKCFLDIVSSFCADLIEVHHRKVACILGKTEGEQSINREKERERERERESCVE